MNKVILSILILISSVGINAMESNKENFSPRPINTKRNIEFLKEKSKPAYCERDVFALVEQSSSKANRKLARRLAAHPSYAYATQGMFTLSDVAELLDNDEALKIIRKYQK